MSYREEFNEVQREGYWSLPRVLLGLLAMLFALFIVSFIATGGDLAIYRFWAPKQESARRQVYEQTKSYRQGSVQRLNTLCSQVASADSEHKPMLNDVISQEFAEWDMRDVPTYLQTCLGRARR